MIEAIILGIVQGLTEFLPVSSSGHLVMYQQFLPPPETGLLFDLVLHLGTLLPILWLYRADLKRMLAAPLQERGPLSERPGTRLMLLIGLGSVPTAIIGLVFQDFFESLFSTPATLAVTFAITGLLLHATRWAPQGTLDEKSAGWGIALAIGTIQGLAIAPGISRSGSTIALALFLGLNREYAARFSFLLSIPAICGAFVLKASDVNWAQTNLEPLLVGGLAAAVSGYVALTWLLKLVQTGDFSKFRWYCWGMATFALAYSLVA
ncbi:MAG: undecaprenyl-diphosphate phosphatase [Myxococcota bacterium]|nr:undecaprenyl-diphosphate phosphatase [Myxococcota bacterium]